MKKILFMALAMATASASAHASEDCRTLALTAAKQLYSLSEATAPVSNPLVVLNPNNTSNGVSLIVTLNGGSQYLVLLSATQPASTQCNAVQYVIAYPYANLIRQ